MASSEYEKSVLREAFHDFKWGRDLVIATTIAASTLFGQFFLQLIPKGQRWLYAWSVVTPYVVVLLSHVAIRLVSAQRKVYKNLQAAHLSLKEQHTSLQADHRALIAKPTVGAKEWLDLAKDFDSTTHNARADWSKRMGNYEWNLKEIVGSGTRFYSLCTRAGNMLTNSPQVNASLSESVLNQSNSMVRWLCFVKENTHATMDSWYSETSEDGSKVNVICGTIRNVGSASSDVCHSCAARESE